MPTAFSQSIDWRDEEGTLVPYHRRGRQETRGAWVPQAGSQEFFLSCAVREVLYEGTRGPGKSDALLAKFAGNVGKGWGAEWRGVLFRRTYPELVDIIEKSRKWFKKFFPAAQFNESEHYWKFPGGERLYFRHFMRNADYYSYHGHEFTWIAWEELTTWPDDTCFKSMFSCLRSSVKGIPLQVLATTNPYGVGHNWVKARYRLPVLRGKIAGPVIRDAYDEEGNKEPDRVAIHGHLRENKILLHAEPNYIENLNAAAENSAQRKAWVDGDWDIVAGGMLDDVWNKGLHVVPNFPLSMIPYGWKINRSFDYGQSKPFSVAWWAQANGEVFEFDGHIFGKIRGDLYRVAEWYGCGRKANTGVSMDSVEIAQGILERENDYGIFGRVRKGPADTNIWNPNPKDNTASVATDMASAGVSWDKADKGPGSRIQGWIQLRKRLKNAKAFPREAPGLFVTERCNHFLRTMPTLPRDPKNMDDVDTDAEDHIADEVRYRLRWKPKTVSQGRTK